MNCIAMVKLSIYSISFFAFTVNLTQRIIFLSILSLILKLEFYSLKVTLATFVGSQIINNTVTLGKYIW
jgi:hypothetical protein